MKYIIWAASGLAILLLLGAIFYYNYLRPIEGMKPTGRFNVGSVNFDYEFSSKISRSPRKLNIKAWYPSHVDNGELDLQQSPRTAIAVTKIFKLPEALASRDHSASYLNAAIAQDEEQYPVVIFNHGFASFMTQNTVQMQELASHGYIVLAIAHPDISLMTEYADGSFVAHDARHPAYLAFDKQAEDLGVVGAQLADILQNNNNESDEFEVYWENMAKFSKLGIYASLKPVVEQWIEDSSAVVDLIATGEAEKLSPSIGSYMAADKIAMMGHSLGGVVATYTNYTNANVVAAVNLDAPPIYTAEVNGLNLDKSNCYFMSDIMTMGGSELDFRHINKWPLLETKKFGCNAVFKGAAHMNFTDMNYVGVMKLFGQLGAVDQKKMGEELNNMMVWYFDKMLKDVSEDYLPRHADIAVLELINE